MKKKNRKATAWHALLNFANKNEWKDILWLWYSTTVTGSYLKETTRRERNDIKTAFELLSQFLQENNAEE
jgi:hypothetical protein